MITEQDVAPYAVPVRNIARRIAKALHRTVSSEDLEQAAWVRLIAEWDRYDPAQSTRHGWVQRVAFWAITDAVREGDCSPNLVRTTRKAYEDGERVRTEPVRPRHVPCSDPDVKPTYRDFIRTAQQTLGRTMTLQERELSWLYFGQGLTMKEAGALNNITETRVCQVITKILDEANKVQSIEFARVGVVLPDRTKARGDKGKRRTSYGGRATTSEASRPHEN